MRTSMSQIFRVIKERNQFSRGNLITTCAVVSGVCNICATMCRWRASGFRSIWKRRRQRDTDSVIDNMRRASSHEERVPIDTNTSRCRMLNYSRQSTRFQIQKGLHCPWCSLSSLGTGGKHLNTMTLPCPILEYAIVKTEGISQIRNLCGDF